MSYTTPYAWLKPRSAAQIALEKQELEGDKRLIVTTCYEAILHSDEPSVRWQAARLLQRLGPLEDH